MSRKISRPKNSEFILAVANRNTLSEEIKAAYSSFNWKSTTDDEIYFLINSLIQSKSVPVSVLCDVIIKAPLSDSQRVKLLKHKNIEGDDFSDLCHKHASVLALSPLVERELPEAIFEKISLSDRGEVRRRLAESHDTPKAILDSLSKDRSQIVRESVASNRFSSVETLLALFRHGEPSVIRALAGNESLTAELFMKVYEHGIEDKLIRGSLIEGYTSIYKYPTLARLASNPSLPQVLRQSLVDHESDNVRSALARNTELTLECLELLSEDSSCLVKAEVASHSKASIEILQRLAEDGYAVTRERVAMNPNTPMTLLDYLANDNSVDVRCSVAHASSTSASTIAKLSMASNKRVREAALSHPNLTAASLQAAMVDHKIPKRLIIDAMLNMRASTKSVMEVMKGASLDARCVVASHSQTDPLILRDLARDKNFEVVLRVLLNPAFNQGVFPNHGG